MWQGKGGRALDAWWLLGELPHGLYREAWLGLHRHTVVLLWCFLPPYPALAGARPVTKQVTGWHPQAARYRSMAQPPWWQLGLSLLPAPAANGDGRGRPAAGGAHRHAGVIHGVGPQGAGALGVGVAARQRPAVVTGHRHLAGEGWHPPWVTNRGASARPRWSLGLGVRWPA